MKLIFNKWYMDVNKEGKQKICFDNDVFNFVNGAVNLVEW